jgi:hypothetical protein
VNNANALLRLLKEQIGKSTPGGCDRCNAYSTLEEPSPGIWSMGVHHDDWCPIFRAMKAGEN